MPVIGFRALMAALLALTLVLPCLPVAAAPSPAPQSAYGSSVALAAGVSSTRVLLTADASIFSTVQIINDGALTVYVKPGTVSVVAAVTDLAIAPGESISFSISSTVTHIAGITASGTATIRINQWNGGPNYASKQYPYQGTTFAALPTASANTRKIYFVTDVGINGSLWISNGTNWKPLHPVTIARSAVQVSHTGDLLEFALATVSVPGNVMGPNGRLILEGSFSYTTGTTNAKIMRIRANNITGTIISAINTSVSGNVTGKLSQEFSNRNATNSQFAMSTNVGAQHTTASTGVNSVPAIDTTQAINYVFTGQLALDTETINLDQYEITLLD